MKVEFNPEDTQKPVKNEKELPETPKMGPALIGEKPPCAWYMKVYWFFRTFKTEYCGY